jgi:hypothetical protein
MTLTSLSLAILVGVLVVVFAVDNDDTAGERPFRRTWTYAGHREFYLKVAASKVELKYSIPLTGPYRGPDYVWYDVLGFEFSNYPMGRPSGRVMTEYKVVLSTVSLFLLSLMVPSVHVWRLIRRQNGARADRCATCGYDLRATPERAPNAGRFLNVLTVQCRREASGTNHVERGGRAVHAVMRGDIDVVGEELLVSRHPHLAFLSEGRPAMSRRVVDERLASPVLAGGSSTASGAGL